MRTKRVFIIAEIGSNHNQKIEQAFELMDVAKKSGADAVKFQSLKMEKLIAPSDISEDDIALFEKIKLEEGWYDQIFNYARKIGIECISAPTYLESVVLLKNSGAKYMKIASPQTYGFPELIKQVAELEMETFLSTGYCEDKEIERAVKLYCDYGDVQKLTLLHCVSQYPTEIRNVNLNYMKMLQKKYKVRVGYSDHTLGITAPIAAVAMGASVIEKHITLSRKMDGPDHYFALEPEEFRHMVENIREAEDMIGEGEKKLTDFEKNFRDSVNMYPYAARNISSGEKIREADIVYLRSKTKGIMPWDAFKRLEGSILKCPVKKGEKFQWEGLDVNEG